MNFKVIFHAKRGAYHVRFWTHGVDTLVKIPEKYWRDLGHSIPSAPASKYERLAIAWAAKEADRRALEMREPERASDRLTLREVFDLYQRENPANVEPKTQQRNAVSFAATERTPVEYCGSVVFVGDLYPEQIDEPVLIRYRNARKSAKVINAGGKEPKLLDRAVRHRTVNNELALLERLVRFAWKWKSQTGMRAISLGESVERLAKQGTQMVALTEQEAAALLAVAPDLRARLIVAGIGLQLREKNLFGLRGEWLDWRNRWLTIPAAEMKAGRDLSRPIPQCVMDVLGVPRISGYIWPNPATGLPFTRLGLEHLCEFASIRQISEHDLRTTGATWLRNAGIDHLTIKTLLGHSVDTGDVTDLYTQIQPDRLRQADRVFDEAFARIRQAHPLGHVPRNASENALITQIP